MSIENFKINHMTTLKDWEDFLTNTLKIERMKPKDLTIKFDKNIPRQERIKRKKLFEQAMWDKFLCDTYCACIIQSLYQDKETAVPPLYTPENTGLKKMLLPNENPKIISPSHKDIIDINKRNFDKETLH